ncbi:MAG: FAD-dependent oxidoreductase [Gemmatimonadales bacterium]
MHAHQSWGRYPRAEHTRVVPVLWRSEPPALSEVPGKLLPFAYGRSYGDSCLNAGGALLDVSGLRRFISFDESRGVLRCEAGVTLAEVLALIVPRGWFVPVVPGTKRVSVAGAIANDVHGKNHHRAGTFGAHVTCFELLRSTGERLLCSPERNVELFRATIGGLGLTGLILWAEFRLKRISGPLIGMERIRFSNLSEFLQLSRDDEDYEYTVAWIDCLARGRALGRGLFLRGDHVAGAGRGKRDEGPAISVPIDLPSGLIGRATMRAFNTFYYHAQLRRRQSRTLSYEPFFFPLDGIGAWNRLYGGKGFLQYQCVTAGDSESAIAELLEQVARSGETPSLAVLKKFGRIPSPGMLSFPRPGITLAIDFAMRGSSTLNLLERLDQIVAQADGAVYPAKDARMSGPSFQRFFPKWESFASQIDPKFSSSFWRRVSAA